MAKGSRAGVAIVVAVPVPLAATPLAVPAPVELPRVQNTSCTLMAAAKETPALIARRHGIPQPIDLSATVWPWQRRR